MRAAAKRSAKEEQEDPTWRPYGGKGRAGKRWKEVGIRFFKAGPALPLPLLATLRGKLHGTDVSFARLPTGSTKIPSAA